MDVLQRIGPMRVPRTAVPPLEVTVEATMANAAELRRRFRSWISVLTDADTADDLSLAVYEALANVVDHAYLGRDEPGPMTLTTMTSNPLATGRDLVVTVTDEGVWRPGDEPGWRGRGLPLMRRLTEVTSVRTDESGTIVQLRRRVAPARQN